MQGELIGVNTAILSPSGASAGIGFAIPSRTVKRVVPKLISEGRYPHPSLGVQLFDLTPQRAQALKQFGISMPVEQGVMIVEVDASSAAARAGLRGGNRIVRLGNVALPIGGDIIVGINDQPIRSTLDLFVYMETRTEVGQTVQIKIIREGQTQTVPVTLAAQGTQ
jgi:S1-C subfamily serine protease